MSVPWIKHPTILSGDYVELVPLEKIYFDDLYNAASDSVLWKYYPIDCSNRETFEYYYNLGLIERDNGNHYPFVILNKKNKEVIGSTRLFDLFPNDKKLEIGWTWIKKEYWGTPINLECKFLLLDFSFSELKTRRVQIKVEDTNIRSRKAIQKIGAKYEGTFRKDRVKENGESRNTCYYSIIDDDWFDTKKLIQQLLAETKKSV